MTGSIRAKTKKPLRTLGIAAAIVTFTGGAALGQSASCVSAERIAPLLKTNFGETLSQVGRLPNKNVIEVFYNDANKTWTVAVSVPKTRTTCVVATGVGEYALSRKLTSLDIL